MRFFVDWLRDATLVLAAVLPALWLGGALLRRVRPAPAAAETPSADSEPATPGSPPWERATTRRGFIRTGVKYGIAGAAAASYGGLAWRAYADSGSGNALLRDFVQPCRNNSPVAKPFTAQLPIPPAINGAGGALQLFEREGTHQFIPGIDTPVWGYNGITPGPTIMTRRREPLLVTFTNQLPPGAEDSKYVNPNPQDPRTHPFIPSSTVVHLHGFNADHASDGYPEERRTFGQSFTHTYPNNQYQRPATFWYHDHSVHITSDHVYRGLQGMYIMTDEKEDASGLPGTVAADPGRGYGFYDIPLIIKDVMIDPSTHYLVYDNCEDHLGAYGDVMTVNGKQQPFLDVANRKYRFRMLAASDSRQWLLALRRPENLQSGPNETFFLIGTDQGLLTGPAEVTDWVHFAPSERLEIVVDFSKYPIGTKLVMVNLLIDPANQKLFQIMRFNVMRAEPDPSRIPPGPLRPPEDPMDAKPPVRFRTFEFDDEDDNFTINGRRWNPARVDAFPVEETAEQWTLINDSDDWGHPVHIHLGRFRITQVRGRAPRPGELTGFKDTVWVGPDQTIKVLHQFCNFMGRYPFHCHNGSHEDHDMMSQFEVVPG